MIRQIAETGQIVAADFRKGNMAPAKDNLASSSTGMGVQLRRNTQRQRTHFSNSVRTGCTIHCQAIDQNAFLCSELRDDD